MRIGVLSLLAAVVGLAFVTHAALAAANGTDGTAGPDLSSNPALSNGIDGSDGADGSQSGENGGNGGAGGHGGNIDQNIAGPSDATAASTGGDGGNGGEGAQCDTERCTDGAGGNGGSGGNGGAVTVVIAGPVSGSVDAASVGGNGGAGGEGFDAGGNGGTGGNGGSVSIVVNSSISGKLTASSVGGAGGPEGQASKCEGFACSEDGEPGAAGVAGTVNVTINQGGTVGGLISTNFASTSTLTFNLDVNSKADFDNAKAYLNNQGNAPNGTVSIDGRVYKWKDFDQLRETLRHVGVTSVTITVSTSSGPSETLKTRRMLRCNTRYVTAFENDNGGITFNSRVPPEFTAAILVGELFANDFTSQNSRGLMVEIVEEPPRTYADVLDGNGELIGRCLLKGPPGLLFGL